MHFSGCGSIASLIGPKTSHVERSTIINASPETVYNYAKYMKNMDEWGVWRNSDKDAKYELIGEDGTVGAKQTWDGDTVMQGAMTITALEPNRASRAIWPLETSWSAKYHWIWHLWKPVRK